MKNSSNSALELVLQIPRKMGDKINYLLSRFPNKEWSGPAWYHIIEEWENGFPATVELVHFISTDLGSSAETEIDTESFTKKLPAIYKKNPKLKDCRLGLIHSHHTLGAFFSSTDEKTARENAISDGLFFSTVVASRKEPTAFGVAYQDRFGKTNFIDGEVSRVTKTKTEKTWVEEANAIEKRAKKAMKNVVTRTYNNGYFGNRSYNYNNNIKQTTFIDNIASISVKDRKKINQIYDEYEDGKVSMQQFVELCKTACPNVDPYLFISGYYDQ